MLDRARLLAQLHDISSELFASNADIYERVYQLWCAIAEDQTIPFKLKALTAQAPLPTYGEHLQSLFQIKSIQNSYRAISIDGSQIYPDKHQGTSCFLINTGLVDISYDQNASRVVMENEPFVFTDSATDDDLFPLSAELVNCKRQEYELKAMLAHHMKIKDSLPEPMSAVHLFDGSLIFWHLESKDIEMKHTFLSCYLALLHQMYEARMIIAGYISLAKAKDLITLMRTSVENKLITYQGELSDFDECVDATIMNRQLSPGQRTQVFKSGSAINRYYPDHCAPYFFYMHVGDEVGRVEIPAWVARDMDTVDFVASAVFDQCLKGRGYPVVLAEAHEQAVIKGPDREFFYHLVYKIGYERNQKFRMSQKSIKKRGIGV